MPIAPSRSYRGYIFDCDGTLVDSMEAHYRSWCEAFRRHGARFEFPHDLFMSMGGMGLVETVDALNDRYSDHLDSVVVAQCKQEWFENNLSLVQPKHEVIAFLRQVSGRFPVAVASGNMRTSVIKTLEHVGILPLVDVIVTQEDVRRGKPNPEIFLLAASKIHCSPVDVLVFEDADNGIKAAESAGMDWIRVT